MEAVGAAVGASLFGYNRKNFFFDGERRLKREYQSQNMRVARSGLWREDVRDLVELTAGKMENYLIINTIIMGLNVVLFTEGRPVPGLSPPWLLWLWAVSGAGSFMYIIICIWLALQASVSSHAFGTAILTQLVRLPIAGSAEIEDARAKAKDYEGAQLRDMFRVPVVKQQMQKAAYAMENATSIDNLDMADQASVASDDAPSDNENVEDDGDGNMVPANKLKHVKYFRTIQRDWQAFDAYARVSMAMGTNQLLQQLAYTCLMGFMAQNSSVLPGMACVLVFTVCASLLLRLDLDVSPNALALAVVLNILPPAFASTALVLTLSDRAPVRFIGDSLIPLTFALHVVWLMFFLRLARAKTFNDVALPINFRSVLYLDVYGWLNPPSAGQGTGGAVRATAAANEQQPAHDTTLAGSQSLLGSVPEHEAAASAESRPQTDPLRASIARTCWEMKFGLETDLSRFEAPNIKDSCDAYVAADIVRLRRQLDSLNASLSEAARDDEVNVPREDANSGPQVWLRMEWNPSGYGGMDYFHPCGNRELEVVWTRPVPPDRVLDLVDMQDRLGELERKVQLLISSFQRCPEADGLASTSAVAAVPPRGDLPTRPASSSSSGGSDLRDAVEPPQQQEGEPGTQTAEPSTQESRVGGAAAVELTRAENSTPFVFGEDDFHPHARRERTGDRQAVIEAARRRGMHMPWSTLHWGSLMLIAAWFVGLFWSVARLVNAAIDIMKPPEPPGPELQLLHSGPWAHEFFVPTGLACRSGVDEGSNLTLLVAEKHAVHKLRANEAGEWAWEPALAEDKCLEKAPEFQAAGLRGVALECTGKICTSMLLGPAEAALRCRPDAAPEHIRLFGGPWQDLSWGKSAAAGIWAQPAATKTAGATLLEPRLTKDGSQSSSEFVPSMQLPSSGFANAGMLDVLDGDGLLELSAEGELQAWLPSSKTGRLLSGSWSYQLPKSFGMMWSGLCTAHGSAYLLGRPTGGRLGGARQPQIWRLQLPAAVAKPDDR